jgi:hypothetical protein
MPKHPTGLRAGLRKEELTMSNALLLVLLVCSCAAVAQKTNASRGCVLTMLRRQSQLSSGNFSTEKRRRRKACGHSGVDAKGWSAVRS